MAQRRAFIVIHGPYGTGKTTLANSAPGPRLVLDAEGGSYDVDKPIVLLEDMDTDALTPDTTVIADVQTWEQYRKVMDLILSGDHPFRSIILDSLTEIQKQLKDEIRGPLDLDDYSKSTYDVWDKLLAFMEKDVRSLRNLTRPSARRQVNVIIVAASDTEAVPRKPLLQGGLRKSLPGFVDLQGYLHTVSAVSEETGQAEVRRVLDLSPTDTSIAEVKCRLRLVGEKYGNQMWDPDIARIIRTINPRPKKATTTEESTA